MENFLECADSSLTNKIDDLQSKVTNVHDQYIRTSTVYQINNKKRYKEEELLLIERQKIQTQLDAHKKRLEQITIQPITLVLKQKQKEIQRLTQIKSIIQDFNKLIQGDEFEMKKLMPLDQKQFHSSAVKIYIFKQLLQGFDNPEYELAKNQIRKKFAELKNKILINFKEAYWKKDFIMMKTNLPYCEQYDLMEEISQFYNQQVFKECNKIVKGKQETSGQNQIRNFFFLLERGFSYAFKVRDQTTGDKNPYQIYQILGDYAESISRKLISYAFQKLIKQSIQNVLKSTFNASLQLSFLEMFFTECKSLLKNIEPLIQDQRISHLISTYFQSVFDTYLQTYLSKQIIFLTNTIQQYISEITQEIKSTKFTPFKQIEPQTTKKFSIKKIMDFKLEEKNYNPQIIKLKIKTLNNIFMASSLEKIFMTIKQSLNRNMKISKINQVDKNRNQILAIFIKDLAELLEVLISAIGEIVPGFSDKTLALEPEFFQIIPNINLILQRMEYLYIENKKQAKYQFAEALKLEQKKQSLISGCQKKLNKIVGDALANILTIENMMLKTNQNQYFVINQAQKIRQPSETTCAKVISFLEKYLRQINKINLPTYKHTLLKSLGLQFINLLIQHYSRIPYTKQGLGLIFIDIANYKKIIIQISFPEIDQKYKILRSLIDVYVIKNQQKAINAYLKTERDGVLKNQKEQIIKEYVANKFRNQKNQ